MGLCCSLDSNMHSPRETASRCIHFNVSPLSHSWPGWWGVTSKIFETWANWSKYKQIKTHVLIHICRRYHLFAYAWVPNMVCTLSNYSADTSLCHMYRSLSCTSSRPAWLVLSVFLSLSLYLYLTLPLRSRCSPVCHCVLMQTSWIRRQKEKKNWYSH